MCVCVCVCCLRARARPYSREGTRWRHGRVPASWRRWRTPLVELLTRARAIYSGAMRDEPVRRAGEPPSTISSGIYKRSRMYVLYIPRALQQHFRSCVCIAASATGEREKDEYSAPATIPVFPPWSIALRAWPSALSFCARLCSGGGSAQHAREREGRGWQRAELCLSCLGSDADDTVRMTLSIGRGAAGMLES